MLSQIAHGFHTSMLNLQIAVSEQSDHLRNNISDVVMEYT
jgi:hypothetical protein